jgi:hypothetical protein
MSVASSFVSNNFTNYPPLYNLTLPANGDPVVLPVEAVGCVVNVLNLSSSAGTIRIPTGLPVGSQVSFRNNQNSLHSINFETPFTDVIFFNLTPLSCITFGFYPSIDVSFQWIILSIYLD